jgi:hypothetical protein
LSIRWYLGYSLDESLPNHSSLTRIRQRLGLAVFRRFFEQVVELCQEAGLVWGKELYFDATKVEANASLDSLTPRFVVEHHLAELFREEGMGEPTDEERPTGDMPPVSLHPNLPVDRAGALAEENAARHDWMAEDGRPDRAAIRYDPDRDVYVCPHDQELQRYTGVEEERVIVYRANATSCNRCPLKARCTTSAQGRQVRRSFDEPYLDTVREYHQGEPYQKEMRKRKVWVEPPFAEAKQWHGLRRFRLRRLWRVTVEALLIPAGQNLKRLLSWRGWGKRPASGMAATIPPPQETSSLYPLFLCTMQRTRLWT